MAQSPNHISSASFHKSRQSDEEIVTTQSKRAGFKPQNTGDTLIDDFKADESWNENLVGQGAPSHVPVAKPPAQSRAYTEQEDDDFQIALTDVLSARALRSREADDATIISRVDRDAEEKAADGNDSKVYTASPSSSVPSTPQGFTSVENMMDARSPRIPKAPPPVPAAKKKHETHHESHHDSIKDIPLAFMSPSVPKRTPPGGFQSHEPPPVSRIPAPKPARPAVITNIAEVMAPPKKPSPTLPSNANDQSSSKSGSTNDFVAWSSPVPPLAGLRKDAASDDNSEADGGSNKRRDSLTDIQQGSSTVKSLIDKFDAKTAQPAEMMSLLFKIQRSLPDVGRLMTHYREAQDKLAAQQIAQKEMEFKYEQSLAQNLSEYKQFKMQKEHEVEKLQHEMENLQQENNVLKETLHHDRAEFQATLDMLKVDIEGLEASKNTVENRYQYLRHQDEKKAMDRLEAREAELIAERDSMKHAYETAKKALEESKANLQTNYDSRYNSKQAELDSTQTTLMKTIAKLEASLDEKDKKLAANQQELMEMHKQVSAKHCEVHSKHAELLSKQAELQSKHVEFTAKHSEAAELKQKYEQLNQVHEARGRELEELRAQLTSAPDMLKEREGERKRLTEEIDSLREALAAKDRVIESLQNEQNKLGNELNQTSDEVARQRELLEGWEICAGETPGLMYRDDVWYAERFSKLQTMVVNFSKENFGHISSPPSSSILEKIPASIPSFLDNTASSRELRAAYVQHVVFKILVRRMFTPFLFTAEGNPDNSPISEYLATLSSNIARTSARRESIWRQHTLKAAYSVPGAGPLANEVAFRLVKEIMDELRHFSDPTQTEVMYSGARRIVKLALETWRLARIERIRIHAVMPLIEGDVDSGTYEEFDFVNGSVPNRNTNRRQILLQTAPRIYRESAHKDILQGLVAEHVKNLSNESIYLTGTNLLKDSNPVRNRQLEILEKQLG
ncbi:hypothetical protein KEM56_006587 [Ascosphaera pollenicola]|nr:hypothetical protein KEM56_006587 [Ascosphaera pollenicola]